MYCHDEILLDRNDTDSGRDFMVRDSDPGVEHFKTRKRRAKDLSNVVYIPTTTCNLFNVKHEKIE